MKQPALGLAGFCFHRIVCSRAASTTPATCSSSAQTESVGAESEMHVGPRKEVLPRVRSYNANDHGRAVLEELGRGFTMRGGPAPTLAT